MTISISTCRTACSPAATRPVPGNTRPFMAAIVAAALLGLAGCGTQQPTTPAPKPEEVRARIARLIPANIPDRQGWAQDIYTAFDALDIPPNDENICSVLAVTVQESTFQATPPVPGLAKIAREEIYRRAGRLHRAEAGAGRRPVDG